MNAPFILGWEESISLTDELMKFGLSLRSTNIDAASQSIDRVFAVVSYQRLMEEI